LNAGGGPDGVEGKKAEAIGEMEDALRPEPDFKEAKADFEATGKMKGIARNKGFTYYGFMNITLSLPEDLVKRVRKIAVDRDTTLTGLVREYLTDLARQDSAAGRKRREREALERSFEQFQFRVGKKTWKREDLYERF
jgi:hypothetical protein